MKQRYPFHLIIFLFSIFTIPLSGWSQCGVGYTQARANWDNLDYYTNNGAYGAYVSSAQARTQHFGIGTNYFTFAITNDITLWGDVTTHTGDVTVGGINYGGADVRFQPTLDGQVFTITFNTEVTNASFTLYDIDRSAVFNIQATNAASVAQSIGVTFQGTTILSLGGSPTSRTITASSTNLTSNSDNQGTATINIGGPVRTITITNTTMGSDASFYFSDIVACVTGSFPTNYQQQPNNEPFQGPAGNQPDYFLVTPDNDSVYMVDPATGNAWTLFSDNSRDYVNSLAWDPENHLLYYISENLTVDQNNRALKRYDPYTGTSTTLVANITTTLGIPTFNSGVESAGAAFYDGALYLGIEGGRNGSGGSTVTRETIFWRIEFDGSLNPTVAYQVFASDAYLNASNTSLHDFGDFIIRDGVLFDFNTARNSSNYSQSKYHHYNLMTGNMDALYNNPGSSVWNGQAAMTWTGDLYFFRAVSTGVTGVGFYDEAGNNGALTNIVPMGGAGWPGGAGDASENFRPLCDFGDAPSSYDPVANAPAVHERSINLRLGSSWDGEWFKTGDVPATYDGGDEDGLPTVPLLDTGTFNYAIEVDVYNNTGSDATLGAWLDIDGDGQFEASEYASATVATNASNQTVTLVWWLINTPLTLGQSTYLRLRVTNSSNGMGASNPTGYYMNGEVEDYQILVTSVLPVNLHYFDAKLLKDKVKLEWSTDNETNIGEYEVERSADGINWAKIGAVEAKNQSGSHDYTYTDNQPLAGQSYYRLRITRKTDGNTEKYSAVKGINIKTKGGLTIMPNPVTSIATVEINSSREGQGHMKLLTIQGAVVKQSAILFRSGKNTIQMDNLDEITDGTYILQVNTPDGVFNQQIIIRNK